MRRAFTLIELLVVISIILILAGMILGAVALVRKQARAMVTIQRMEEITRSVHGNIGSDQQAADYLHRRLATMTSGGLMGVTRFKMDRRFLEFVRVSGSWIPRPYQPPYFPNPWGQRPTDRQGTPTDLPDVDEHIPYDTRSTADLRAHFSPEFMVLAGLIKDDASTAGIDEINKYYSDRNPDRPWNDAWGNPLVVGMGFYQPRLNDSLAVLEVIKTGGGHTQKVERVRDDLFVERAHKTYGYAKAFYLSVGALGPKPPSALSALSDTSADWTTPDTGLLDTIYASVTSIAGDDGSGQQLWRTVGDADPSLEYNAWSDPPWKGVRKRKENGQTMFLSAPVEIR
jgi:prepilin-type N-terminal cleavage/methylation domain-containing protein